MTQSLNYQNMKYEKLIYGLGAVIVITGALLKIFHLPYGNAILLFGFVGTGLFQTWHITQLKKRIEELENRS